MDQFLRRLAQAHSRKRTPLDSLIIPVIQVLFLLKYARIISVQKKQRLYLILAILLVVVIFFAILLPSLLTTVPQVWHILQTKDSAALEIYLRSFGFAAVAILFVLQFLQSLLPIFPAIVLQIVAGVLYGPIWGTILVVFANALANYLVFIFLRRFERDKLDKLFSWKPLRQLKVYFQSKNPNTVVFLFYLLPFLTNAFVPYLAATTKITKKNFLFSMFIATLPMTFLAVYLGDTIVRGDWRSAIVLIVLITTLTVAAFFLKDPILRWLRHKKKPTVKENS